MAEEELDVELAEGNRTDLADIFRACLRRHTQNPEEPAWSTVMFVALDIGSYFADVECSVCEWTGLLVEAEEKDEVGWICPEGHSLKPIPKLVVGWQTPKAD